MKIFAIQTEHPHSKNCNTKLSDSATELIKKIIRLIEKHFITIFNKTNNGIIYPIHTVVVNTFSSFQLKSKLSSIVNWPHVPINQKDTSLGYDALKKNNITLEKQLNKTKIIFNKQKNNIEKLNTELTDKTTRIRDMRKKMTTHEDKVKENEYIVGKLRNTIKKLNIRSENEINKLKDTLNKQTIQINTLLSENINIKDESQKNNEMSNAKISDLRNIISEKSKQITLLNKELSAGRLFAPGSPRKQCPFIPTSSGQK